MRRLLPILLTILIAAQVRSQVTSPMSGTHFETGTLTGSDKSWTNLGNAGASDQRFATFGNLREPAGTHTNYLRVTGFKFGIPPKAVINGILVQVESYDPYGTTADYSIRIIKDGSVCGEDHSTGAMYLNIGNRDHSRSYGGSDDLWGEKWTVDDVLSEGFGVAVAAQRAVNGSATGGEIDDITITIYYSLLATLPLTLTHFEATPLNDRIRLSWNTADESGMDRFELQRSENSTDFQCIGTVLCRNRTSDYSFTDYNPVAGKAQYRLKILARDGSFTFSKTSCVDLSRTATALLYPNPWKKGTALYIRNGNGRELHVTFYDHKGQLVASVSTGCGEISAEAIPSASGILRYKVYEQGNEPVGIGSLVVY